MGPGLQVAYGMMSTSAWAVDALGTPRPALLFSSLEECLWPEDMRQRDPMSTQVREGHFQACKLLTPVAEMVSWYRTLKLRSPEITLPSTLGYHTEPLLGAPPPCANLALSPALLSVKVEVKMSGFLMLSSHAVPQQPVPLIFG